MIKEARMTGQKPVVNLYPLSNYTFPYRQPKITAEKDDSDAAQLARLRTKYEKEGMCTSVYGILLVHAHNHPHVLLLQINERFKLLGGKLKPRENEIDGLKRKLHSKLRSNSPSLHQEDWQIGECIGVWWRPNFETWMYPYCPAHITKPKECKKLYLVHLPECRRINIPKNVKFNAVALFHLYATVAKGSSLSVETKSKINDPIIYHIPEQLSRFRFNMVPQNPPKLSREESSGKEEIKEAKIGKIRIKLNKRIPEESDRGDPHAGRIKDLNRGLSVTDR